MTNTHKRIVVFAAALVVTILAANTGAPDPLLFLFGTAAVVGFYVEREHVFSLLPDWIHTRLLNLLVTLRGARLFLWFGFKKILFVLLGFFSLGAVFSGSEAIVFAVPILIGFFLYWIRNHWMQDGLHREEWRGARQIHGDKAVRYLDRATRSYRRPGVYFGGTFLPYPLETEGFIYLGTAGSGKSLFQLLTEQHVVKRIGTLEYPNNQLLCVDQKNEKEPLYWLWYAETHPKKDPTEGTIQLYPFFRHSSWWDMAADLKTPTDADLAAEMLLPDGGTHSDPLWTQGPRQLLSAEIQALNYLGIEWDFRMMVKIAQDMTQLQALIRKLPENPVADLLDTGKTALSFQAQLVSFMNRFHPIAASWDYLKRQGNRGVRLRDFPGSEKIYLLGNHPEREPSLGPMNRLMFETVSRAIRASNPGLPQDHPEFPRHVLSVEEAVSFGFLPGLTKFFDDGRSKGGVGMIGCQDIFGLRGEYGEHTADKLLNLISNKCVGRSDGPAADVASEIFGDVEVIEYDADGNPRYSRERVIEPGELRCLPQMTQGEIGAYFKVASVSAPWLHYFFRSFWNRTIFADQARAKQRFPAPQEIPESAQTLRPFTDDEKAQLGITSADKPNRAQKKSPPPDSDGAGIFHDL